MFNLRLEDTLANRKSAFQLRSHTQLEGTTDVTFRHAGQEYLSFSSNNYLGLANHPQVVKACEQALQKYGVGSGSAYLISGYTKAHQELEEELAHFLGYPQVLVFSCGYMANLGAISGLFSKSDNIFADKLNHASLVDGCLSSKASFERYPHCDHQILARQLATPTINNKLIVTEGLFGMDGTVAPLREITALAKQHNAMILLDDAHAIGVLGPSGKGTSELYDLSPDALPILTGSFGKAFGSYGAFVAGSHLIIENLKQVARTYIYTTAIPPAIACASLASLKVMQQEGWRRDQINELIRYFKKCATQLNLPQSDSQTAIQPIILGSSEKALKVSQNLLEQGIFVRAIRPPTVPKGSARLRITLTAQHSKHHIDILLERLAYAIHQS
jgi:8-amino-7-oxononanoate synthase